jgi:hypothetical protein
LFIFEVWFWRFDLEGDIFVCLGGLCRGGVWGGGGGVFRCGFAGGGEEDGLDVENFVVRAAFGVAVVVCVGVFCGFSGEDDVVAFAALFGVQDAFCEGVPRCAGDVAGLLLPLAFYEVGGVDGEGEVCADGFCACFEGADGGGVFDDGAEDGGDVIAVHCRWEEGVRK